MVAKATPITPPPTKGAYSIAKALHHAKAAAFYFELTITEEQAVRDAKRFLQDRANECHRVIRMVTSRTASQETKTAIHQELTDPLWLDAMCDTLIALKPEAREQAEAVLNELLTRQGMKKSQV